MQSGRRAWTTEEDAALTKLVAKHGKRWTIIALELPGRRPQCCREHWNCVLSPFLNKVIAVINKSADGLLDINAVHKLKCRQLQCVVGKVPVRMVEEVALMC